MRSPVNASPIPSRVSAHELGVDAVRYSFIVMDLHHLLLAGLPAHSALPLCADFVAARDAHARYGEWIALASEGQLALAAADTTISAATI